MALLNQRRQQTLSRSDFPTPVNWNMDGMRYKLKMSRYVLASCALVCFEPTFHVGNVVGCLGKEQPINRLVRSGNVLFVDYAGPKPYYRKRRVHPTDSIKSLLGRNAEYAPFWNLIHQNAPELLIKCRKCPRTLQKMSEMPRFLFLPN